MYSSIFLSVLVAGAAATHPMAYLKRTQPLTGSATGVATFNNYGSTVVAGQQPQQGQNCPNRDVNDGATYLAASGDLSPNISGGSCPSTQFTCSNGSPVGPGGSSYVGPHCNQNNCGTCYKVTNKGGFNGDMTGVGKSITVGIVDACPSNSGQNQCKSDPDPRDKCASNQNALDIDIPAYKDLTGVDYQPGVTPNLNVAIENC